MPTTILKEPEGLVYYGASVLYVVCGYLIGFAGLFHSAWPVNLVATMLLAHAMIIAAYLIHECGHQLIFKRSRLNARLGRVMSWFCGAAYGTFEDMRYKHFRHHVDNGDVVWFEYEEFFAEHPLVLRVTQAFEWFYIPAHDLIMQCWTKPGLFRWEGKYYHHRVVNPWVLPIQKPHPPIWFPGGSSPESVMWAANHRYTYINLGALMDLTLELKQIYIDTAHEVGFNPGPEHFGYQVRAVVADTDEKAQKIGRGFLWNVDHRMRGPAEHNDPPGYQSRVASALSRRRAGGPARKMSYEDLQEVGAIVVGSPDTVIKKLTKTVEQLNPGYLILIGSDGDIAHKDVMRSIELLGREVIPALHQIKLQAYE